MTMHEFLEKQQHIRATHDALRRARIEHDKAPTYDTAALIQQFERRIRELRGTFPKPSLVWSAPEPAGWATLENVR